MHSTIFFMTEDKDIDAPDEDAVFEGMHGNADYVNEECDEKSLEWAADELRQYDGLNVVKLSDDCYQIEITAEAKAKCFKERFNALKESVENLTFEQFCNDGFECWKIQRLISDVHGWNVCDDYGVCDPFDTWLRYSAVGKKFYLKKSYDYHF